MATIHVDGKEYEVNGADNLLQACLSLGLDIPYFCWHPALGSVGACRQCAVKQYQNAEDTRGRLVMSCMTPATDGTFISIDDEEAKQFRESVVEWLMTNHPHDCPVCEEGGNCHLQDMTVMTGHSFRRYRFTKRTHRNQDLGPFISHEMNRCIACYRCVRYYKDYADGTDLGVYGAHDNVYFGRPEDGTLESEFSGNLVEMAVSILINHHVRPFIAIPQAAGRQQRKATIKGRLPRFDVEIFFQRGLNPLIAGDMAHHAVAVANHVATDRLTENLAVECGDAFDVARRNTQHIGNSVDRAVRHPATLLLNDFQRFNGRRTRVFVVVLLVLYRFTLCRTQLKSLGLWLLILVHN